MEVVISCGFVSFRPMQKCLWVGFFGFGFFFSPWNFVHIFWWKA